MYFRTKISSLNSQWPTAKKGLLLVIAFIIVSIIHAQPGKIDSSFISRPLPHSQTEYTVDQLVGVSAWQDQKKGLHLSFASAGDAFMIYPGATSSIRFEKMREGIVDCKKIKIIKMTTAKSTDPSIKKIIEELSDKLGAQTGK